MPNSNATPSDSFLNRLMYTPPQAKAWIVGSSQEPQLSGIANFYQTEYGGVLIEIEVFGLPNIQEQSSSDFYGIHIHEHGNCMRAFQGTGEHYNPGQTQHPHHSGDLPPLLGNQGYAYSVFYDKRFMIDEIIGRSIVIHSQRDDFTSQPAGDSGAKIGCGTIRRNAPS